MVTSRVGVTDGVTVGAPVLRAVGRRVGLTEWAKVGFALLGAGLGLTLGVRVGDNEGRIVGMQLGTHEGLDVNTMLGTAVGR